MPLFQRWGTYVLIAALVTFAFYRFHSSIGSAGELPIPSRTGKFDWSKVAQRYPVKSFTPLPSAKPIPLPKVQHDFAADKEDPATKQLREKRRAEVKKSFLKCWNSYKKYAWLQDELAPLSGKAKATFGGWAATLIDALDTLWIMDLKTEFQEAVAAVQKVDLSVSSLQTVNVFETTIRHLGGLLGAYDLSGDKRLLSKAVEVADMLYVAFDTPNRMPITRWDPAPAAEGKPQTAHETTLVAEIGSLTMEFTRLAQLTGEPKWYDAVARITSVFAYNQAKTQLPGMWPVVVNAAALDFSGDNFFTLGAMADSLYEYLPKMHALLGGTEPLYHDLYTKSMETAIKHTVFRPMTPDAADIMAAGSVKVYADGDVALDPEWQHLVCFAGGMFVLGGKLFSDPAHAKLGAQITDGCVYSYRAWPLGIMPEVSHLVPCAPSTGTKKYSLSDSPCAWDEAAYAAEVLRRHKMDASTGDVGLVVQQERLAKGFSQINDRRYVLRPEAIESVFVLWRTTGEKKYQDAAWDMWAAVERATQTELANAALVDMTMVGSWGDSMESFWMAETLKYFFLVFSEPDLVSLDDFVLNTEAHPFRIPK